MKPLIAFAAVALLAVGTVVLVMRQDQPVTVPKALNEHAEPAVPEKLAQFELQYDRLTGELDLLSPADRAAVDESILFINEGEHMLALLRLSSLSESNPQNSSLRILASYAMLQGGNLVGAFEEAEKAHKAPDGNSYQCWFLAKVALLNGKKAVCERELRHVEQAGDMVAEEKELEEEFNQQFGLE